MADLSPDLLARSRVIAKGRRIREVQRLVDTYGGVASRWVKKSSPVISIDGELHEYRWYEYHGLGRLEIKTVRIREK